MYESLFTFFGLRENPFDGSLDPKYLFVTPRLRQTLADITFALERRNTFLLLTGDVGTGKTFLIHQLLQSLRERGAPTAFIFYTHLDGNHIFDFMLADFGIHCESRLKSDALQCLHDWLLARHTAGETPVLIVDEAQGLLNHALHEIQMLLNLETPRQKLLQIVLAGEPPLEDKLKRPEFSKLRQRVTHRCTVEPFSGEETQSYIQNRLRVAGAQDGNSIFDADALRFIDAYSRGIPRIINLLCEQALIREALARGSSETAGPISAAVIQEVARHFQLDADAVCMPQPTVVPSNYSEPIFANPTVDSFLAPTSDAVVPVESEALEPSCVESDAVVKMLSQSPQEHTELDPQEDAIPAALAASVAPALQDPRIIVLPERKPTLPETQRRLLAEFLKALAQTQRFKVPVIAPGPFVVSSRKAAAKVTSHPRAAVSKGRRLAGGLARTAFKSCREQQTRVFDWLRQQSEALLPIGARLADRSLSVAAQCIAYAVWVAMSCRARHDQSVHVPGYGRARRLDVAPAHARYKLRRRSARRGPRLGFWSWPEWRKLASSAADRALWEQRVNLFLGWLQEPVNPIPRGRVVRAAALGKIENTELP